MVALVWQACRIESAEIDCVPSYQSISVSLNYDTFRGRSNTFCMDVLHLRRNWQFIWWLHFSLWHPISFPILVPKGWVYCIKHIIYYVGSLSAPRLLCIIDIPIDRYVFIGHRTLAHRTLAHLINWKAFIHPVLMYIIRVFLAEMRAKVSNVAVVIQHENRVDERRKDESQ